jgi:putative ubiquitin-RnfH superfamily antitoxin RatB of RatAB toxin-antitoxin module
MARVDGEGEAAMLRVAVACSPGAGVAFEIELQLAPPATAWDAVRASGVLERWPELVAIETSIGVWGRAASPDASLRDGDRVELYRPLAADPQEARRQRARKVRASARR